MPTISSFFFHYKEKTVKLQTWQNTCKSHFWQVAYKHVYRHLKTWHYETSYSITKWIKVLKNIANLGRLQVNLWKDIQHVYYKIQWRQQWDTIRDPLCGLKANKLQKKPYLKTLWKFSKNLSTSVHRWLLMIFIKHKQLKWPAITTYCNITQQ